MQTFKEIPFQNYIVRMSLLSN